MEKREKFDKRDPSDAGGGGGQNQKNTINIKNLNIKLSESDTGLQAKFTEYPTSKQEQNKSDLQFS